MYGSLLHTWRGRRGSKNIELAIGKSLYSYPESGRRVRRSAPSGSFDNRVYIDSIGVPRGLPDEF